MDYLIGDIGGTRTRLSLFKKKGDKCVCIKQDTFLSQTYPNLTSIVRTFLEEKEGTISKGCFGVAGPIKNEKAEVTNLPWTITTATLLSELPIEKVTLLNDLEASAYGIHLLQEKDFFTLHAKESHCRGNKALISPGTGLGEAGIFFDGQKEFPFACEGGHTDFAPQNPLEEDLLRFLREKFGHVSYERIVSGPGLRNVYQFVVETRIESEKKGVFEEIMINNSSFLIAEKGARGESKACQKALDIFCSVYGAEVGNLALKLFSLGGVYLGGSITSHLLDVIQKSEFLRSFKAKGRFSSLLNSIPVRVILNDQSPLLGALYYAMHRME